MFKKLIGGLTSTAVVAGMVAAGVVATATPAAAVDIPLGTIESRITDNFGTNASGSTTVTSGNCLTYNPTDTPTSTAWVNNSLEAQAGHGYQGSCPAALTTSSQSVIGFRPATTTNAETGTKFLLGRMTHYNQPISSTSEWFKGNVQLRFASQTFTFPYLLHETPNNASPPENPANDDILSFTAQISSTITGSDGMQYRLVVDGFVQNLGATCPAEPPANTTINNEFVTTERATTPGCLYGSLTQVRPLKLVKEVVWDTNVAGPTSIPQFNFTSTSTLEGSPWKTNPGVLQPTNSNGATAQFPPAPSNGNELLARSETVTITESAEPANWQLTNIKCVDGAGQAVGTVSTANRVATLANVNEAATPEARPITCAFTNTFKRSNVTLVKTWSGVTDGGAAHLTITGGVISPTTGDATAPASDSISTGANWGSTVTVSETQTGTGSYSSALECKAADDSPVTVDRNDSFTMPNQAVTCTYTNTRDTASLKVAKEFAPLTSGFTGKFDIDVNCDVNSFDQTVTLGAGESQTISGIPTGTKCEVTEPTLPTAPTGWTFGTPTVNPSGQQTIGPKGTTTTVKVTNTISRDTAQLLLVKQVPEPTGSLTPDKWTLKAENDASPNKNYSEPGNNTDSKSVWAETPYTLSEVPDAATNNYTAGNWSCEVQAENGTATVRNGRELLDGNVVTVPSNTTVVCTIVNERNLGQLKLIKQVEGGKAQADEFTLTAKADPAEKQDLNISTKGGSGKLEDVYAGTEYTLAETGPGGYSPSDWVCLPASQPEPTTTDVPGQLNQGDKITLEKGQRVECTIVNTRDVGSLKIIKSFNPKTSGYDKAFNIDYKCGDDPTQTVAVKAGQSKTIDGIPTGTECTVSEVKPTDPPAGWSFSDPTYDPANGKVTVSEKGQTVAVTVTNEILNPGIKVEKSADKTQVAKGGTVVYTYKVTNTGDATLTDVKVTDDKCSPVTYKSGDTNTDGKLQTNETWLFECTTTLNETTVNTAVVKGKDENGQPVTDEDTAKVIVPKPGIKVEKSADKTEVAKGGTVVYTYKVTNTGDATLTDVKVTDDKCSPVTYKSGDTNTDGKLQTSETWLFECTTTLNETTVNTAVVKGKDETGQPVTDEDTAKVIVPKPGMKIVKSASATTVKAGESVTYTYTVTNTGDTPLSNVTVTDDKCSPVEYKSGDTNGDKALDLKETWTFTCTTVLNVTTTNVAVVTGKDKTGQEATDKAQATVTVTQVSPIVAKQICPIDVTLHKPQPKKVGNKVMTDKIKTKKSSCVLLKPVVLCRPLASTAAGETAFCETKVTKKGRITVKTKGYKAVRVSVIVRTKPKPGFEDLWKPNTWRKSWKLT